MSTLLEGRVDDLTYMLMEARKQIRVLTSRLDSLEKRPPKRKLSSDGAVRAKAPRLVLSDSESEADEPAAHHAPGDVLGDSESEPDEPAAQPQAEHHAPGDVFETLDGFCIFLGGQNWGWLYQHHDLPPQAREKIPEGDYVVSDYDYIMLDTANKTVRKLPLSEAAEVTRRIRADCAFLSDSNSLLSLKYPKSPTETIAMLKKAGVQTDFGKAANKHASWRLLETLVSGRPSFIPVDRTRGRCGACNLKRMISHRCKLAGRTMCVGLVCKKRMDIISDLLETHQRSPAVVFLFKFLDTLHELTKLKAEASGEYAT